MPGLKRRADRASGFHGMAAVGEFALPQVGTKFCEALRGLFNLALEGDKTGDSTTYSAKMGFRF